MAKSITRFTISKPSMSTRMSSKNFSRVFSNESSSNSENDDDEDEETMEDKRFMVNRNRHTARNEVSSTDLGSRDNATVDSERNSSQQRKSDNDSCVAAEDDSEKIKENFTNTFDEKGPFRVGAVDAIEIATVLEELSDKLDIVGVPIVETNLVDLRSKGSKELDAYFHRPLFTIPATEDPFNQSLFKEKYFLRQRYETQAPRRFRQLAGYEPGSGYRDRLSTELRAHGVNRYTQKGKIYSDKTQLNIILDNVCTELLTKYSFDTLQNAVEQEKMNFREMQDKFDRKIQAEKRIQETREALKQTRIQKRLSMKDSRRAMMGIEDSKQEILRRKELEFLYVQYTGAMMKSRVKKMCGKTEREVRSRHDDMKRKMRLCGDAHGSMLEIIFKKYKEAKTRLEYWMDKYELDKENLQSALDTLKANRTRDLERIRWLKAYIYDYNQICKDDRRIKGIANERERILKLKEKKAIKLQSWWRGEMVRKRLGPYMTPEERARRKRALK